MLKLSIIIITFNCEQFVEKCIASVLKFLPDRAEVIVFDNASIDETISKLENFLPKIRLYKSEENLGFAKANNRAVENAFGEFLFFLNPDTVLTEPIFESLIRFYENTPKIGILAPKLIMENGKTQPSVIKLPSITGAIREFVFIQKGQYLPYAPEDKNPVEVECVFAAAVLIKKDFFLKLKGFDARYFMYYEDIDLCRRIKKIGYKIYYYPKYKLTHKVGGIKSEKKQDLNLKSAFLYHGFFKGFIIQAILRLHRFIA